jgi:hypothetical protein
MSDYEPSSQPPAYGAAAARRGPSRGVWMALLGCGGAVVLTVVVFAVWVWWIASRELPPEVQVEVEAPLSVASDAPFDIVARVTNGDDEAHTLVDLDVAQSYLAGIAVVGTEPPFSEALRVPIAEVQSYSFNLALPAGKTVEVRFHAVAAHPGDHDGTFDFCIDNEYTCVSYPVRTLVRTPGAEATVKAPEAEGAGGVDAP